MRQSASLNVVIGLYVNNPRVKPNGLYIGSPQAYMVLGCKLAYQMRSCYKTQHVRIPLRDPTNYAHVTAPFRLDMLHERQSGPGGRSGPTQRSPQEIRKLLHTAGIAPNAEATGGLHVLRPTNQRESTIVVVVLGYGDERMFQADVGTPWASSTCNTFHSRTHVLKRYNSFKTPVSTQMVSPITEM